MTEAHATERADAPMDDLDALIDDDAIRAHERAAGRVTEVAAELATVLDAMDQAERLRAAEAVLAEPMPTIWPGPDGTLRTVRFDGELTTRDALSVRDGQVVTIVLTARITRKTTQHEHMTHDATTVTVEALDILDGLDVVTGPSSDALWQEQREAWDTYNARRDAAMAVVYPRSTRSAVAS